MIGPAPARELTLLADQFDDSPGSAQSSRLPVVIDFSGATAKLLRSAMVIDAPLKIRDGSGSPLRAIALVPV